MITSPLYTAELQQNQQFIEQNMNKTLRSEATIDSYPPTSNQLHNCPTCRCKSTDQRTNSFNSQPFLSFTPISGTDTPTKSLYYSQDLPQAQNTPRQRKLIFQSTVFPKRMEFVSSQVRSPPSKAAIKFTYQSPTKREGGNLSCDSKLVTKSFKEKHFPHLQAREQQGLKKIITKKQKNSCCYYEIFTQQEGPAKPKVLKMNKNKSKQKLEITISKKSNSQKSIHNEDVQLTNQPYNDYGLETHKPTPINLLWEQQNAHSRSSHRLSYSQLISPTHRPTPSIENIQISRIQGNYTSRGPTPLSSSQQINYFAQSNVIAFDQRLPSVRSFQSLSAEPGIQKKMFESDLQGNYPTAERKAEEPMNQKLRLFKDRSLQESQQLQSKIEESDLELARTISDELDLHFDYFGPQKGSNKSLSVNFTL